MEQLESKIKEFAKLRIEKFLLEKKLVTKKDEIYRRDVKIGDMRNLIMKIDTNDRRHNKWADILQSEKDIIKKLRRKIFLKNIDNS